MIQITGTCQDQSVTGRELDAGLWRVDDEAFAEFMRVTEAPPALLGLGGTYVIATDLRSADPFVRAETFKWFVERFLRLTFGNERVIWEESGFDYPELEEPEGVSEPVF